MFITVISCVHVCEMEVGVWWVGLDLWCARPLLLHGLPATVQRSCCSLYLVLMFFTGDSIGLAVSLSEQLATDAVGEARGHETISEREFTVVSH